MRIKNKKLEWYVINSNFMTKKIEYENIFSQKFIEDLHKEVVKRKKIKTLADLKEYIKRWAMYHYWSKCEFEIVVGSLFKHKEEDLEKIDVYYQLEPNLDRITEYVNNELQIGLK